MFIIVLRSIVIATDVLLLTHVCCAGQSVPTLPEDAAETTNSRFGGMEMFQPEAKNWEGDGGIPRNTRLSCPNVMIIILFN
jgi:hypothetical protein